MRVRKRNAPHLEPNFRCFSKRASRTPPIVETVPLIEASKTKTVKTETELTCSAFERVRSMNIENKIEEKLKTGDTSETNFKRNMFGVRRMVKLLRMNVKVMVNEAVEEKLAGLATELMGEPKFTLDTEGSNAMRD